MIKKRNRTTAETKKNVRTGARANENVKKKEKKMFRQNVDRVRHRASLTVKIIILYAGKIDNTNVAPGAIIIIAATATVNAVEVGNARAPPPFGEKK